MPDGQQRPDGSFSVVVPAPCFSVWLARGAKVWPERLVIMVEEFCQLFCGYFLDRHLMLTFLERLAFKAFSRSASRWVPPLLQVLQSRPRQSRVADVPNKQPDEACTCTPCTAQPGIAHKMRYHPRTAPLLPLWRTFPASKRCLRKLLNLDHWIRKPVNFE
jgi:hypothetical protein